MIGWEARAGSRCGIGSIASAGGGVRRAGADVEPHIEGLNESTVRRRGLECVRGEEVKSQSGQRQNSQLLIRRVRI